MSRRKFLFLGGIAVGGVIGMAGYSRWFAPYRIVVSRHQLRLTGLPGGENRIRIKVVQLTDIHRSPVVPTDYIRRAVKMCNELKPDVIVLTGDYVTRGAHYIWSCAEALKALRAQWGVYAVLGNHDHWTDAKIITKVLERSGINVLVNQSVRVLPGLWLCGLDDWWSGKPDLKSCLRRADSEEARILLSHNPRVLSEVRGERILVLAGHTHGCQVLLPPLPPVQPIDCIGTPYIAGWYSRGKANMYVNRGIGMVFPPIRFRCPPEISLFELQSG